MLINSIDGVVVAAAAADDDEDDMSNNSNKFNKQQLVWKFLESRIR